MPARNLPLDEASPGGAIVSEEQALLGRVEGRLASAGVATPSQAVDYDQELIDLRDQIAEAKPEDVAPLVEQMARLSGIAERRGRGRALPVDPASPYFAHLRLSKGEQGAEGEPREPGKKGEAQQGQALGRDILIGKRGFIDRSSGVQIVDWRNAPISRIYYRYEEGDDFDEQLPRGRLEGIVEVRRNVTIASGQLRRIGSPQGVFVRGADGTWYEAQGYEPVTLGGGQGTAARPPRPMPPKPRDGGRARAPGRLGEPKGMLRADKRLPEIAALIDRQQFDLITQPTAGLVVIEGGAGSGKTTVALHRVAYLHYQDPQRFRSRQMLVVVPSEALVRYVQGVLPALGVHGVPVTTARGWMRWARKRAVPAAPDRYTDETPRTVSLAKKHPALLGALETFAREKLEAVREGRAQKRPGLLGLWAELLTDRGRLRAALPEAEFSASDVQAVVDWCSGQQDEPFERTLGDFDDPERALPVDGRAIDEGSAAGQLDPEDDALLLRLAQVCRRTPPVSYEHVAIDEAQDLSVAEVKVLLEAAGPARSVTLCGDAAQRVVFDNAFESFDQLLGAAGFTGTAVRPLGLSYRSTQPVMELARAVLGPLAPAQEPIARAGEPVELHGFSEMGPAVAFVAEALRSLMGREPFAQVALLTRHIGSADGWFAALSQAEIPSLRRVRRDEFPFKAGIDVTDVAQVKGLEFDYVLLLDANATQYPDTVESRHLLHIGATRAVHQLWLITIGAPSPILPKGLVGAGG